MSSKFLEYILSSLSAVQNRTDERAQTGRWESTWELALTSYSTIISYWPKSGHLAVAMGFQLGYQTPLESCGHCPWYLQMLRSRPDVFWSRMPVSNKNTDHLLINFLIHLKYVENTCMENKMYCSSVEPQFNWPPFLDHSSASSEDLRKNHAMISQQTVLPGLISDSNPKWSQFHAREANAPLMISYYLDIIPDSTPPEYN